MLGKPANGNSTEKRKTKEIILYANNHWMKQWQALTPLIGECNISIQRYLAVQLWTWNIRRFCSFQRWFPFIFLFLRLGLSSVTCCTRPPVGAPFENSRTWLDLHITDHSKNNPWRKCSIPPATLSCRKEGKRKEIGLLVTACRNGVCFLTHFARKRGDLTTLRMTLSFADVVPHSGSIKVERD